jgi:hypothetical protein
MFINRIYQSQNLLSLYLVSSLVGLRTYQHQCTVMFILALFNAKIFLSFTVKYILLIYPNYGHCKISRGSNFDSRQVQKSFLSSIMSRPAPRHFQPPIQCVPGAISPLVKLLKREASHLPAPSIES